MVFHQQGWQPRGHQVAEALSRDLRTVSVVDTRREDNLVVGKQLRNLGDLIEIAATLQVLQMD